MLPVQARHLLSDWLPQGTQVGNCHMHSAASEAVNSSCMLHCLVKLSLDTLMIAKHAERALQSKSSTCGPCMRLAVGASANTAERHVHGARSLYKLHDAQSEALCTMMCSDTQFVTCRKNANNGTSAVSCSHPHYGPHTMPSCGQTSPCLINTYSLIKVKSSKDLP